MKHKRLWTRLTALTAALALFLTLPASAAIPPACDETYYATLDASGGLLESSVVKSIRTRGVDTLTDYGKYDNVVNLTDSRAARMENGKVTFDLTGDVPDKFYFECKTTQPYEDFPWTLHISYTLNGVPTPVEQLAGRSGVVEIILDAVPNGKAGEYSRNNLVLTAASLFNADDILSLEAPGAQVQLLGNLYTVLYAVLPGEEQHFTIRVGTDAFSYNGMIFLAVPATLEQMSQVADLREAKEKTEASYHAMNDSLHAILDTLNDMTGSLNAAANGLDQLNNARGTLSSGKNDVYGSIDEALAAAGELTGALAPTTEHLTNAQEALTKTNTLLNEMTENLTSLKPEVEETRKILKDLQTDLTAARDLLDDLEGNELNARLVASNLTADLGRLQTSLSKLQRALGSTSGITVDKIDIGGMTSSAEVKAAVAQLEAAHAQYEGAIEANQFPAGGTFETFLVVAGGKTPDEAKQMNALYEASQAPDFDQRLEQLDTANGLIGGVSGTLGQVNTLLGNLTQPTAAVVGDLTALTGDLEKFADMMTDILDDLDDHSGVADAMLHDGQNAAGLLSRLTVNIDTALDQVEELTGIVNEYEPGTQKAMEDAKVLVDTAIVTVNALSTAAKTTKDLIQRSGLDSATRQSLTGLADTLRRSTKGLEQTDTVRTALDTIDSLITDEWDSHVGGDNNVLLMDANAKPVSITDSRNGNVGSIQYVMRTQEIKVLDDAEEEPLAQAEQDNGTFWSRVKAMFVDIWAAFIGIFRFGKQ